MMVLLRGTKRKVIARFNTQNGFGGLKWGEFIGTRSGEELLNMLRKHYCPAHHNWYIVSDFGYSNIPGIKDGEVIYTKSFTDKQVGDFALNTQIRSKSLEQSWTTSTTISMQDNLRNAMNLCLDKPHTHVPYIHVKNLRKKAVRYVY